MEFFLLFVLIQAKHRNIYSYDLSHSVNELLETVSKTLHFKTRCNLGEMTTKKLWSCAYFCKALGCQLSQ